LLECELTMHDVALDLKGKTAVVTGSSSGIGRAIALEFARAGAVVIVHAGHDHEAAQDVCEQISQLSGRSHVIVADLSTHDQQDHFVEQAWTWADGEIDVWVNNAGVDVLTGESENWSFEEKLSKLLAVDVTATMRISRAVGQRMKQQCDLDDNQGPTKTIDKTIINIGWDQAEWGMAGDSGEMFAATKGAVMAFSRSLAQTLAPEVRVNCLAPGWIRTRWAESATEVWQQRACRESLLSRWGTPEDVARAAHFLASAAGAFVTGQVIQVNGGARRSEE